MSTPRVAPRREGGGESAFFFGCWGAMGHYFYSETHDSYPYSGPGRPPIPWIKVDSALAPRDGKEEMPQGVAALHHLDGWTALSFWDRTGDSRGNSSSTFFFAGTLDFDESVAAIKARFPKLWERFDFAIIDLVRDNTPRRVPQRIEVKDAR